MNPDIKKAIDAAVDMAVKPFQDRIQLQYETIVQLNQKLDSQDERAILQQQTLIE